MTKLERVHKGTVIQRAEGQFSYEVVYVGHSHAVIKNMTDGFEAWVDDSDLCYFRIVEHSHKSVSQLRTFLKEFNNSYDVLLQLDIDGKRYTTNLLKMVGDLPEQTVFLNGKIDTVNELDL